MAKVNLKELAQVLNVSISTVSKALRGSYEIGEATKQRIVAKAEELGYTPNPYAGFCVIIRVKTLLSLFLN